MRALTGSVESGACSQRLGLLGPASPVSSGGEGRRCGKLLREIEKELLRIDGLGTGFFGVRRGDWMEKMEEKKSGFWDRLHESRKKQVLFFVVSMAVLFAVYFPCMYFIQTARTNEILRSERTNEDINIVSCVEQVSENGNLIEVSGWAIRVNSTVVNGHVILQPTDGSEGMPMTLLEAMASALPIVSTNVGGIPTVLRDGENALLSEPKTSQIVENIVKMIKSEEKRKEYGENAYKDSTKYSVISMTEQYLEIYHS